MIAYLLMLSLIVCSGVLLKLDNHSSTKKKIFAFCFWLVLLTVISGFRGAKVGTDTPNYILMYRDVLNGYSAFGLHLEYGFTLFCKFLPLISKAENTLVFFCSLLTNAFVLLFIFRNSKNIFLSVFLYISLYFFFMAMNAVRQFLAISIVLTGTEFAKSRKLLPFLLIVLAAFLIHTTAIMGLFIYVLFSKKLNEKAIIYLLILFISSFLALNYLEDFIVKIFPKYIGYVSGGTTEESGIMFPLITTMIFISCLFLYLNYINMTKKREILPYLLISEITAVFSLCNLFFNIGISYSLAQRLTWLFQIYSVVLIPNVINSSELKGNKKMCFASVYSISFVYLVYYLSINWNRVVPFYFFGE